MSTYYGIIYIFYFSSSFHESHEKLIQKQIEEQIFLLKVVPSKKEILGDLLTKKEMSIHCQALCLLILHNLY